jgi:hypothetical protein
VSWSGGRCSRRYGERGSGWRWYSGWNPSWSRSRGRSRKWNGSRQLLNHCLHPGVNRRLDVRRRIRLNRLRTRNQQRKEGDDTRDDSCYEHLAVMLDLNRLNVASANVTVVEPEGFEPLTPCLQRISVSAS